MLGAGTGALIGTSVAGPGNRMAGAVVGALLGGLIGNRIGAALDDEDKQRAYAAQLDALDRGPSARRSSWQEIRIPGAMVRWCRARPISKAARNCRSFTHTIYIS